MSKLTKGQCLINIILTNSQRSDFAKACKPHPSSEILRRFIIHYIQDYKKVLSESAPAQSPEPEDSKTSVSGGKVDAKA